VAGDVGDGGDLSWRTASSMYVVGSDDPFDVLFLLGDNVYPNGEVALLHEKVLNPFASLLDTGADLIAVLGNHDGMAPDGGARQMELLGMPGRWWSSEVGSVLLVGLDTNQVDNPAQLDWLDATLASSDARWKVVGIHQSPYSAGYQGSSSVVREDYVPIFERHGVQLVLSGHDHDYQRSNEMNGVTYVVSGAGAGVRRTGSERYTTYSASTPHFVDLNVFADRLVLRAVDHDLRMFDQVVIESRPAGA
jgi:3',5'-cyclic AMP phosphodiesterase CpdA